MANEFGDDEITREIPYQTLDQVAEEWRNQLGARHASISEQEELITAMRLASRRTREIDSATLTDLIALQGLAS